MADLDSYPQGSGIPNTPSYPLRLGQDERRVCYFADVDIALSKISTTFDWTKPNEYSKNVGTLAVAFGWAEGVLRGELERINSCADMSREEEILLNDDEMYSDLKTWLSANPEVINSIVKKILDDPSPHRVYERGSRLLDAFTEFACESHDKTHKEFLSMNLERATQFTDTDIPDLTAETATFKLRDLVKVLKDAFKDNFPVSRGTFVSQSSSRKVIDLCSLLFQERLLGTSLEVAPASYLGDITRANKDSSDPMEGAPDDDNDDGDGDDNDNELNKQVYALLSNKGYVIPDACNPKKEDIFDQLVLVFFIGALVDAADTSIPDSSVRCLFIALQTFFTIGEYRSFFGFDMPTPPSPAGPFTFTAGFECGAAVPESEYPKTGRPLLTYMQETSGGEFKYALCSCFSWGGIKTLVKSNNDAKFKKQFLAPIVFIYYRYKARVGNTLNQKLKKCSLAFVNRVKTVLLEQKIKELNDLIHTRKDVGANYAGCIITPDPLAYFTDEDGSLMFLCAALDTAGPSLANNATLLLALSGTSDDDIKRIIAGCIRGDQNFDSCKTLLNNVLLIIINDTDIPSDIDEVDLGMLGGAGYIKKAKASKAAKQVTTQITRKEAQERNRQDFYEATGEPQPARKPTGKPKPAKPTGKPQPVEKATGKPPPQANQGNKKKIMGVSKELNSAQLQSRKNPSKLQSQKNQPELQGIFNQVSRRGGLDWKEVMDRLKGRAGILVYLLTKTEAVLFTVDVCLAKSLCHIILCVVRHSMVLSFYGQLITELNLDQKKKINLLKVGLINKGRILVKRDSRRSDDELEDADPISQRQKYLKPLHYHLSSKMKVFEDELYTRWHRGISIFFSIVSPDIPNEYLLFDFLYMISASAIIRNGLICDIDDFVHAFSVVNTHTPSTYMLVRQYLRIKPDTIEKIHALCDNQQDNWSKSLSDILTRKSFTSNTTMLNLLWKKAGCGGIDKNNVHLLISELSLGELCAEHYNLRLMPTAWP
jgi:hypothetical protein